MTNEERQYIILKVIALPLRAFNGTIDECFRLNYYLSNDSYIFQVEDDNFLNKLYGAHVQVIGECFTCFSKTNPMRLIKLDENTIRIICDSCRENLHSAKSN